MAIISKNKKEYHNETKREQLQILQKQEKNKELQTLLEFS